LKHLCDKNYIVAEDKMNSGGGGSDGGGGGRWSAGSGRRSMGGRQRSAKVTMAVDIAGLAGGAMLQL
jgi:hypothetical protein